MNNIGCDGKDEFSAPKGKAPPKRVSTEETQEDTETPFQAFISAPRKHGAHLFVGVYN